MLGPNKRNKKRSQKRKSLLIITLALVLAGCGGGPATTRMQGNFNGSGDQLDDGSGSGNGNGNGGGKTRSGPPPLTFQVEGQGWEEVIRINVLANCHLKVRYTPEVPDRPAAGNSGFYPKWSQQGHSEIKVGSTKKSTPLLGTGWGGTAQQSSGLLDFSNEVATSLCQTQPNARRTFTIELRLPQSTYWCDNWGTNCPYLRVWETHFWKATLEVETDDTGSIQ